MAHVAWPSGLTLGQINLRIATLNRSRVSVLSREGSFEAPMTELWLGQIALPARARADVAALNGFLASLEGRLNDFGLPLRNGHFNGAAGVSGTLTSDSVPGAETLVLSNPPSVGDLFSIGDIESPSYQVFEVFEVAGATVRVSPRVRYRFFSGEAYTTSNVRLRCRLLADDQGALRQNVTHGVCTLELIEAP